MTDMNIPTASDNPPIILPIREVMENNYLDYAMSVITDRALPDVRDGLKPVHRRILYAMHTLSLGPSATYKKSARVVGDVIGKYHPHGDSAVYDAAVRMAQPWVMQHPLIDGQGNFGSLDGDGAAAMRYTEMRMTYPGQRMFTDIGKDTVDFRANYDGTEKEPIVLPVSYPNLWVNGSEGIAVGMATSVAPHNLGETIAALLEWIENPEMGLQSVIKHMPAPDFPSGGIVHGMDGYHRALETGRGAVKIRGRWHEEDRRGGKRIVFTEIPYLVNKAKLVESIAELVNERKIDGIVDLRDETSKKGVRLVIDVKKGFDTDRIALQLISDTQLETSFNYNVRALVNGRPMQLGILDIFQHFKDHRIEVIKRRTQYDLTKALDRLHILEGYLKALDMLDETIQTIRDSNEVEEAKQKLIVLLGCSEIQAQAILDLRLQRLTGLQIKDIRKEHGELTSRVADLRDILASETRQISILTTELNDVRDLFKIQRRTEIAAHLSTIENEDLIEDEEVVLMATKKGFLKRMPVAALNRQGRGTKGRSLMEMGDGDLITAMHTASTRDYLLAVTSGGQVHAKKVYDIPDSPIGGRGRHYRNTFEGMADNTHVVAMLSCQSLTATNEFLVLVSSQGFIKKTEIAAFANATRRTGLAGVTVEDDDYIVSAKISKGPNDRALIVGSTSRAACFELSELRPMGRSSRGVRSMKLDDEGRVLAAEVLSPEEAAKAGLLCIGENGVGKVSAVAEFTPKGRGGKGMVAFAPNRKSGPLSAAAILRAGEDIVIINDTGGGNRIAGANLRFAGRGTAGSYLMKNGRVSSAITVPAVEDNEDPGQPG